MVLPRARGSSYFVSRNFCVLMTLSIDTIFAFLFGTSMPMVPFPGIGAIMRMPNALRESAMSSSRFRIRAMRTPWAGFIS